MKWLESTLDELGSVSRGRSRHRPRDAAHLYGGKYPFVQTGDVKHAGLYLNSFSQTYSEDGLAQSKLWPKGTLCITIAANIADTSILDIDACFPDSVIGFIPDPEKADARFIKYLFDARLKLEYKQFTQGAAQDNLSQAKLLSINLQVPENVIDQARLADYISKYDDLIENNNRRIALLEESARLLYQEWFVHLRFPGHEHCKIIDGVPEGWVKGTVSDLFQVENGYAFKSKDWREEGNPVIKIKNITGSGLIDLNGCQCIEDSIAEKTLRFQIYPQDVLIAMTGATVGKVGIMPRANSSYFLNQRVGRFEPKLRADSVNFIYLSSKFDFFKKAVLNLAGGAAQPNISGSKIESIKLIVPQEKILNLFLDEVKASFQQRQVLIELNSKLTEARDILLPRLMNGEIVV